jgi:hypothetical protein
MSTFINSIDANHMISIGDEGFLDWNRPNDWPYNAADGVDHEALTSLPNIDYGTYHVYPDHWSRDVPWVTQWIIDHQTAAAGYGKPVILEEFGFRNQSLRDSAFQTWVDTVRTGGGDGWAVWILTGIQDDGSLYPDFDGFRVTFPSSTATLLSNAALAMGGGGGGDVTPPTTPGTPAASGVTATSASLSWAASTDSGGSGLAGYNVYRRQGTNDTLLTQSATNSAVLTGLSPATQYVAVVRARDVAGNLSAASATVTFTTLPDTTGGRCRVVYSASNWGGSNGFTASVTVTNTGTATLTGWTLAFTFPAGQRVTDGWSATWNQPTGSANVTAVNMPWNGNLAPNASTGMGFNGSHTGSNPAPAAFTLNGNTCTTA